VLGWLGGRLQSEDVSRPGQRLNVEADARGCARRVRASTATPAIGPGTVSRAGASVKDAGPRCALRYGGGM